MKPEELLFAKTHEWVHVEPDAERRQDRHGRHFGLRRRSADRPGLHRTARRSAARVKAGESFGEIESVKAVSDLYSPVERRGRRGERRLPNELESLHDDPYGAGWIVKIKLDDESALAELMDYAAYQKQCAEEGH